MGRNCDWKHLYNRDVISMPDKWEYPWVRTPLLKSVEAWIELYDAFGFVVRFYHSTKDRVIFCYAI